MGYGGAGHDGMGVREDNGSDFTMEMFVSY